VVLPSGRVDRLALSQVLLNLLSNAIKYNDEKGHVTLEFWNGDGRIKFKVTDTGSGISEENIETVFEPFNRLGREQGTIEGIGIGLALSREPVHSMGGKINLIVHWEKAVLSRSICLPPAINFVT